MTSLAPLVGLRIPRSLPASGRVCMHEAPGGLGEREICGFRVPVRLGTID